MQLPLTQRHERGLVGAVRAPKRRGLLTFLVTRKMQMSYFEPQHWLALKDIVCGNTISDVFGLTILGSCRGPYSNSGSSEAIAMLPGRLLSRAVSQIDDRFTILHHLS